jgi:cytoskeletal protein RodZ
MFELGNNLREARQRRRIDLVAAEQDTKIRSKYLAALETEDFDVLPGPVFVRGFLRTYSRYLDLDPQLFIDEYNARFGRFEEIEDHDGPALGQPGLAQERDRRGRRTMRTVVLVTIVAIATLAWLGLRSEQRAPIADSTATPNAEAIAQDDATAPAAPAAAPQPGALRDAARTAERDAPPAA